MADEEFLEAFSSHLDRIHNLARGLTATAQDAEDLVQETCLLALRGWRRRPPDDPSAWFATICLNAARSGHRRRAARPGEVFADAWLAALPDPTDTARSALAAVDASGVREALGRLPAAQREAITLMDLSGFTASETARLLRCPRGTVLARVHRGRKALAAVLQDPREVTDDGA
jgi:RNA polymerase sigma-70 factor (ECF subfamily)